MKTYNILYNTADKIHLQGESILNKGNKFRSFNEQVHPCSTLPDEVAESKTGKRLPRTPEKEDAHKIAEHSTYAYQKLTSLDEKLANKTQALHALKLSQKADKKVRQPLVGAHFPVSACAHSNRQTLKTQ